MRKISPVIYDPDGDVNPKCRYPNMDGGQRLATSMAGAAPVQQFTPDQQYFRDNLAGRYQADAIVGASVPLNRMRQDANGCTDVTRMEPSCNPTGSDSYLDMGGAGGTLYAAGRA